MLCSTGVNQNLYKGPSSTVKCCHWGHEHILWIAIEAGRSYFIYFLFTSFVLYTLNTHIAVLDVWCCFQFIEVIKFCLQLHVREKYFIDAIWIYITVYCYICNRRYLTSFEPRKKHQCEVRFEEKWYCCIYYGVKWDWLRLNCWTIIPWHLQQEGQISRMVYSDSCLAIHVYVRIISIWIC